MLPLGEAEGGQGVPFGLVPAVLGDVPGVGVEGDDPGLDGLGFVDPGFDDPAFGVEPFGISGVTQGVPLGVVPGLFVVDGFVVLPGVGVDGKLAPGIAPGVVAPGGVLFVVPFGQVEPGVVGLWGLVCGVVLPAAGVAVRAGGVAVLAGGVAVPGEL